MRATQVAWIGGKQFVAVDSSRHSVVMSTQDEGNGTGMKPVEMLLAGLAGCTAVDSEVLRGLRHRARRGRDHD